MWQNSNWIWYCTLWRIIMLYTKLLQPPMVISQLFLLGLRYAVHTHWFGQFHSYHHKQEFGHILCCIALYPCFQTLFSQNEIQKGIQWYHYYVLTILFTTKLLILFEFFLSNHSFYRFLTILFVGIFVVVVVVSF